MCVNVSLLSFILCTYYPLSAFSLCGHWLGTGEYEKGRCLESNFVLLWHFVQSMIVLRGISVTKECYHDMTDLFLAWPLPFDTCTASGKLL